MKDIRELLVPNTNGQLVPLEKIARLELVWEPGMIWRHNRQYALTLQADVSPGVQGATVALELQKALEPVKALLPIGVKLEIGGTIEESAKGQASIFCRRAHYVVYYSHAACHAASKHAAQPYGSSYRAAGPGRRGCCPSFAAKAFRVCSHAWCHCPHGHDYAQCCHSYRSN
jgi:Cation/multidrug efflux pump